MLRAAVACALTGFLTASCGPGSSTPTNSASTPDLEPLLLTTSDLPAGWSVSPTKSSSTLGSSGCPAFDAVSNVRDSDSIQFVRSGQGDLPQLAEALGWSRDAVAVFDAGTGEISECKHLSFETSGLLASATVVPISFPQVGSQSAAYQLAIDVAGTEIDFDITVARKGSYLSLLAFGALGQPDLAQLETFVTTALAKLPSR